MQMKRFDIRAIALAMGMAFGAAALAQGVTQDADKGKAAQTSEARDAAKAGAQPRQMDTPGAKAAQDKRDADYVVAKEKCGALAGEAKLVCMDQAKAMHGKS
jgi:hypothetical protein